VILEIEVEGDRREEKDSKNKGGWIAPKKGLDSRFQ